MKMKLAANFFLSVILFLTIAFVAGCKTTPPIDWNSRVGTYMFDQAVTDFGPPDKQAKLSDGKTVAEWITHRSGGTGLTVGTGFYTGGVGVGVGQSVGSGYSDKILTLTFGTNSVLAAWSKNY
jgi:hypothetical protein